MLDYASHQSGSNEPLSLALNYPPVIGVTGLSDLLGKSEATVLMDRHRSPWRVPPECTPTGSKSPLWLTVDVINWLAGFRRPAVHAPAEAKRGRPTKAAEIAARRAAAATEGGVQ